MVGVGREEKTTKYNEKKSKDRKKKKIGKIPLVVVVNDNVNC